MVRRTFSLLLSALLLCPLLSPIYLLSIPPAPAFAASMPVLMLNLDQGPLGVTLTLRGKNFPPGQANLSYIDANGVPGTFSTGDSVVQVQNDGTFTSTNVVMPASGSAGVWKVVVTDSTGQVSSVPYNVLAAPGQQMAGTPGLTISPTSGTSGDLIAFSGSNWLPSGTAVNLMLLIGSSSIPLLEPLPASNGNGEISGTFHLPSNSSATSAIVSATDANSGDLRAQAQLTLLIATPTASPTTQPSVTPTATATRVPMPTPTTMPTATPSPVRKATPTTIASSSGTNSNSNSGGSGGSSKTLATILGAVLLIVGTMLGVLAFILVLFMIPRQQRQPNMPRIGQF